MKKADFEDVNQIRLIPIHYAPIYLLMFKHNQLVEISLELIRANWQKWVKNQKSGLCFFTQFPHKFRVNSLEMSSSWNFPARASPSYEVSGSSEPELGHFNFRAETELKFF